MKILRGILIFVLLTSIVGCKSQLKKERNNNQFKFLVLSDIHVSDNESHEIRLNELVEKFNTDKILSNDLDFVTATGDNVSYLYSNRDLNRDSLPNNKLRSYINAMSNLNVPYHSCMGNHEYKIDKKRDADGFFSEFEILEMEKIWKKETGLEPYYSIKKGDFTLLFLNSNRGRYQNNFFGTIQINWIKNQIAESKNVIMFYHHPMSTDNIEYWYKKRSGTITKEIEPDFYDLLSQNNDKIKAIFVGHGHKWMHDILFNSIMVYQTTSFGDNEEFMFYSVEVLNDVIKVTKSVNESFFEGFTKFKNQEDE